MGKVLIVEDEKAISDIVAFNLKREGHEVFAAYDGKEALEMFEKDNPDLVLLDVMLPYIDGFEVCRRIRETSNLPIIMMTAREEEADKVFGLENGADDYVTKPFSMKELMARVKANIRRSSDYSSPAEMPDIISYRDLSVNRASKGIFLRGKSVELSPREYDLIAYLIVHRGEVFSREDLIRNVWNYEYFGDMRTVDVTIRRLREKIEDDPANPVYIITRRGAGYLFGE